MKFAIARKIKILLAFIILLFTTSCSILSLATGFKPAPKLAEVYFEVEIPADTSPGEMVYLELFEPSSGTTTRNIMSQKDELHFIFNTNLTVDQMINYRYLRGQSAEIVEADTAGNLITYRNLFIDSPMYIQDIVSAWSNHAYTGITGTIQGNISYGTAPLQGFFASAAGQTVPISDQGTFEISGLRPGTHWLVIFSMDNQVKPFQQQAIIAPNAVTPVNVTLN